MLRVSESDLNENQNAHVRAELENCISSFYSAHRNRVPGTNPVDYRVSASANTPRFIYGKSFARAASSSWGCERRRLIHCPRRAMIL